MGRFDPAIDSLSLTNASGNNPCTMPLQELYRDSFPLAPINDKELALFKAQFSEILMMQGSDERKLMIGRVAQYMIAMRAIKKALNEAAFAGIYAEDTEVGMGYIRPQFIRSAAAYRTVWTQAVAVAWADWFFEGAGNPYAVGRDFGMVITHLKSLNTPLPLTTEVRFNVGRTQLLPVDTRNLQLADTENDIPIIPLPTMILIPKASFYARIRGDAAGNDALVPGGLVFGLGRVLREEVPLWLA